MAEEKKKVEPEEDAKALGKILGKKPKKEEKPKA